MLNASGCIRAGALVQLLHESMSFLILKIIIKCAPGEQFRRSPCVRSLNFAPVCTVFQRVPSDAQGHASRGAPKTACSESNQARKAHLFKQLAVRS